MPVALSYAHGACANHLLGQTIGDNLRETVERHGDREAFVSCAQKTRLTYRQFWNLTTRLAKSLLKLGIVVGERVGIWSPNRIEWPIVQYASARIGAILVNINPAFRSTELEYVLRQSGLTTLFLARGFKQTDYGPILESVRDQLPDLRTTIQLDSDWKSNLDNGDSIDDSALFAREQSLGFDDPINIQYTSGTTGHPKGATLTHHNILNNGYFVGERLHYNERDRVCVPVPFYHCFGMVLGCLVSTSHGSCLVIPSEGFDPQAALRAVAAERCTALYGVPTMFVSILEQSNFSEFDVSSLRTGVMAGSPCPIELMRRVVYELHMPEVAIGYGMTEMSPIATMTTIDDPIERRVGSVGRVFPHVEAKVIDTVTGATAPVGTAGEFCARGPGIMREYWNDPQATAAAIDSAGWMHSGDQAVMDGCGYVYIVGRIKDTIIRGGENISPREIEEFLLTHPDVSEAQVIGVPSAKYGEEVMAWIKPRRDCRPTIESLMRHCAGSIAPFKMPRHWKFVDAFPLTVTGKVQKFRMREIAVQELALEAIAKTRTA